MNPKPLTMSELLDHLELRVEGFNLADDFGKIAYYYSSHVHCRRSHAEKILNGYIEYVIEIMKMINNEKLIDRVNEFRSCLNTLDKISSNPSDLIKSNFSYYFKHSHNWDDLMRIVRIFRTDFDQFGNLYELRNSFQFEELVISDSSNLYYYLTGKDPKKHINKFKKFSSFLCQSILESKDQFNTAFKSWNSKKGNSSSNFSWLKSMANIHPEWNIQKKYLQYKT